MKKLITILLITMCLVAGCGSNKAPEEESDKAGTETEVKEEESAQPTDDGAEDTGEEAAETVSYNLYRINDETGEMDSLEVTVAMLDAQTIWQNLKDNGIVSPESWLISMSADATGIVLDTDAGFGEYIRGMGTAGENEVLKCIAYTYLEVFEVDQIKFTEAGQPLVTGHRELDQYMSKDDF